MADQQTRTTCGRCGGHLVPARLRWNGERWTPDGAGVCQRCDRPDPDCYSCGGTGKVVGFGHAGMRCPCVDAPDEP